MENDLKLKMEYLVKDDSEELVADEQLLSDDVHKKLVTYLVSRLDQNNMKRTNRHMRYANIDKALSTWQKLNPANSERKENEEQTGVAQALPMNLPLAKSYIEDTAAFCAEIFAPLAANFYSNPGTVENVAASDALVRRLNADSKANGYYAQVASLMQTLFKYNIGGVHIEYVNDSSLEMLKGNRFQSIDVYNVIYDEAVVDVTRIHCDAEFVAMPKVRSRSWLLRKHRKNPIPRLEEILRGSDENQGSEHSGTGYRNAKYYRHPPTAAMIPEDGQDSKTAYGDGTQRIDWKQFGLDSAADAMTPIDGHEIITMYAWINEKQFGLSEDDKNNIVLYRFVIVDHTWIIDYEAMPEAEEIPVYMSRVNPDELHEAARSYAELILTFQRLGSFQLNTYIDGIRGDIYGLTVVDPNVIEPSTLRNGNVAGVLVSKQPGRDIRSAIQVLRTDTSNSRQNFAESGAVLDLARQFFPNQGLPAQVASIDRAVTNQVSTVMQGAMRKMHMVVRILNETLMLQTRKAQYQNLVNNERDALAGLSDLSNEDVLSILDSGIAQLNREMAAQMVEKLVFTLLQNPESIQMAGIDMSKLLMLYSMMLNIGSNLGDFRLPPQPPTQGPPVDPAANPEAAAAADPAQAMLPGMA